MGGADEPLKRMFRPRRAGGGLGQTAWPSAALFAVPLAFLALFFYYPLVSMLAGGLSDSGGRFSLGRVLPILRDPYYRRIIGFTFEQAFLSTLLSLALGLPGAYLLARYEFAGKRVVRALSTVPFVLPSIILVLGFVRFFGNNGVLNRLLMGLLHLQEPPLRVLYSFWAILLAHAFYNFPVAMRIISALWARLPPTLEEAARSLGAHGPRLFLRVTLPQLAPGVLASAALIYIFCFLSFAVVLVLGGGPRFTTLEVDIYRLAKVGLDLPAASALALIGALLSLLALFVYLRLQARAAFAEELELAPAGRRFSELLRRPLGFLVPLYLAFLVLVVLAPILTVVGYSLQGRAGWSVGGFSLAWYGRLLDPGEVYLRAIRNSLFFAALTVALSVPLGTALAYLGSRRRTAGSSLLEPLLMLPLGVSTIILGLGYLQAYRVLPWLGAAFGPLSGSGGWPAVVFAHTVIAYPFVVRAVSPVLRKIKPSLPEAARSLGAGGWQLFLRLELPLLKSALLTGAAFAFGISVGEINATLMLATPQLTTMPIAVYRLIGSYNFVGASAMGTLLMLLCFLAFLVIDRMGREL
jgi:thiamine transport system permease protein